MAAEVQLTCGAKAAIRSQPRRSSASAASRVALRRVRDVEAVVGVERVRGGTDVAQELEAALHRARRLELVGEHRRDAQRDLARVAVEHVQQRQVGGRDRLPQPLLAERPRAEALDVGHVGVQDELHGRSTASRSSERSSPPRRSVKSLRGDRRREALVERARDVQRGVHAIPARPSAPARARAACGRGRGRAGRRWPKWRSHSSRYSSGLYSRTCHGLPERSAPFGREREHVRRGDVGDAAGLDQLADVRRASRPGPGCARSSAGTRRSPRRPARARSCCARR